MQRSRWLAAAGVVALGFVVNAVALALLLSVEATLAFVVWLAWLALPFYACAWLAFRGRWLTAVAGMVAATAGSIMAIEAVRTSTSSTASLLFVWSPIYLLGFVLAVALVAWLAAAVRRFAARR